MVKKEKNKLIDWFVRNKKVLWWPIGGLIYSILAFTALYFAPSILDIIIFPVWFFVAVLSIFKLDDAKTIILAFIAFESFLTLMGYAYNKSKSFWTRASWIVLFVLILLLILAIITNKIEAFL